MLTVFLLGIVPIFGKLAETSFQPRISKTSHRKNPLEEGVENLYIVSSTIRIYNRNFGTESTKNYQAKIRKHALRIETKHIWIHLPIVINVYSSHLTCSDSPNWPPPLHCLNIKTRQNNNQLNRFGEIHITPSDDDDNDGLDVVIAVSHVEQLSWYDHSDALMCVPCRFGHGQPLLSVCVTVTQLPASIAIRNVLIIISIRCDIRMMMTMDSVTIAAMKLPSPRLLMGGKTGRSQNWYGHPSCQCLNRVCWPCPTSSLGPPSHFVLDMMCVMWCVAGDNIETIWWSKWTDNAFRRNLTTHHS